MKLPPGHISSDHAPPPPSQSHGYSGYGQRMMESMGWAKGKGLGKNEQGRTEHVKVKKKDDNLGVGVSTRYDWTDKWWESAFNSIANKLAVSSDKKEAEDKEKKKDEKSKKTNKKKRKDDTSSSSSSESESESESEEQMLRDGIKSNGSKDELKILEDLQKDKWGRWGGRDGKMARVRAQEERMAAEAHAKLAPTSTSGAKHDVSNKASDARRALEAKTNKPSTSRHVVIEIDIPELKRRKLSPPTPTPKVGWWGARLGFISSGFMGYKKDKEVEEEHKRKEFTEADQERAYMEAHLNKKQGHGGLGLGKPQGPSTLGNDFVGQKKTFGEEEEREEGGEEEEEEEDKRKRKKDKKKDKAEKIDWKRVLRKVLKDAPEREMKVKHLVKAVVEQRGGDKDVVRVSVRAALFAHETVFELTKDEKRVKLK